MNFIKKKWGSIRTTFSLSGYYDPESENYFANISAKTKIFSKIFKGVNLGSRYNGFMKKPDFENLMLLSL